MASSEPVLEVKQTKNFTDELLGNLMDMRSRKQMTDFTIMVNSTVIPCHSVIMSAASPYFKVLLQCPMKEATTREVELNFLNEVYVQRVVDYCYTGKITVELSAVEMCLDIAEYFQLCSLKCHIEKFVCEQLCPKNCVGWYYHADKYHLDELEKKSKAMMISDFPRVVEHPEFHELTMTELLDYIEQVVNGADGDVVLNACLSWVTFNVQARSEDFLVILNHIQLDACSSSCLKGVLHSWKPVWPNCTEIQQLICKQMNNLSLMPQKSSAPRKLKLLLLGGHSEKNVLNRNCWAIDLITGKCEVIGKMAHFAVKYMATFCATKEGIFVIGGSRAINSFMPTEDFAMLRLEKFQWIALPKWQNAIAGVKSVCVRDHIYTFDGEPSHSAVSCLKMSTPVFISCPDMPTKNVNPIIVAIQDEVYYIFQTAPDNEQYRKYLDTGLPVYCFDTTTHSWSELQPAPRSLTNTRGARAVSVGNDLFLVGGMERLCVKYSPHTDSWVFLKGPKYVHRGSPAVHMDGQIILPGGWDENSICHTIIEVYDIAQDSWSVHGTRLPTELQNYYCIAYDDETKQVVF